MKKSLSIRSVVGGFVVKRMWGSGFVVKRMCRGFVVKRIWRCLRSEASVEVGS